MNKILISMVVVCGFTLQSFAEPVIPSDDFTKKLELEDGLPYYLTHDIKIWKPYFN